MGDGADGRVLDDIRIWAHLGECMEWVEGHGILCTSAASIVPRVW